MAEKDRQADDFKTSRIQDILRAKDIIPGTAGPAGKGDGVSNTDIPHFDLAEDIMVEHRRLTAERRRGPGGSAPAEKKPFLSRYGFSEGFNAAGDPVIADIVARDIELLCRGLRA
ncbi:MAG: hypothetical protein WBL85_11210 [Sedimentisphaerales bacterium]